MASVIKKRLGQGGSYLNSERGDANDLRDNLVSLRADVNQLKTLAAAAADGNAFRVAVAAMTLGTTVES